METNENNIKALAKLGVDAKDIANIYLNITEKGADISKDTYINNLTEMIKFFQSRNKEIENDTDEAIYKEDVLDMVKNNKRLVSLNVEGKIKSVCQKLDSYYFMTPGYTNKLIKKNPKIFNINSVDLEVYSTLLSNYAIKVEGKTLNLLEYIIKQDSSFLENDVQKIFGRMMYFKDTNNSKLCTMEDLEDIKNGTIRVTDEELKEKYKVPSYKGETMADYSKKIVESMN